jgi:hypothetical protein
VHCAGGGEHQRAERVDGLAFILPCLGDGGEVKDALDQGLRRLEAGRRGIYLQAGAKFGCDGSLGEGFESEVTVVRRAVRRSVADDAYVCTQVAAPCAADSRGRRRFSAGYGVVVAEPGSLVVVIYSMLRYIAD